MEKIIRDARPEDAPEIARIITLAFYSELCDIISGGNGEEGAFILFNALAAMPYTQYSYQNTIICEIDGEVAGGICGYDGKDLLPMREHLVDQLKSREWKVPNNFSQETSEGEFYLDSMAVYPQFRGMGIGSDLLNSAIDRAAKLGFSHVGLLVDFENPDAEKLYNRLGFSRVGVTPFMGHSMYHMQKEV